MQLSLRSRLFLVFGSLVALLVCAQWWLVRTLTQDLRGESGEMALSLGSSFLAVLGAERSEPDLWTHAAPDGHGTQAQRVRAFVLRDAPEGAVSGTFVHDASAGIQLSLGDDDGNLSIERTGDQQLAGTFLTRWAVDIRSAQAPRPPLAAPAPLHELERLALQGRLSGAHQLGLDPLAGTCDLTRPAHLETLLLSEGVAPESLGETRVETIPIPSQGIDTALESFSSRLLAGSAAILVLGLLVAGLFAHRVSTPLRDLARAAHELGAGALGRTVPERGDPEVLRTIGAFNAMSLRLADLDAEARSLRERRHLSELGEIARGFAHTLRNPLHVLGLTLDELSLANPCTATHELHAIGRAQIRRVDQAVRGFLVLASGDAGRLEDVQLFEMAQDVALELLQAGAGEVEVEVKGERNLALRGIGAELRAVLHSLVVNAVEASPRGGRVDVHVEAAPGGGRLVVEDRGPGLPETVRERLFTPHLTTKEHGAGMGLFLAWRIATGRYHGSLELEHRPGGGTRAVLLLRPRREDERAA